MFRATAALSGSDATADGGAPTGHQGLIEERG
jgi:hypothetical protein